MQRATPINLCHCERRVYHAGSVVKVATILFTGRASHSASSSPSMSFSVSMNPLALATAQDQTTTRVRVATSLTLPHSPDLPGTLDQPGWLCRDSGTNEFRASLSSLGWPTLGFAPMLSTAVNLPRSNTRQLYCRTMQ